MQSKYTYCFSIDEIKHFSSPNNSRLLSQFGFFPSQGIFNSDYIEAINKKFVFHFNLHRNRRI